MQNPIKTTYNFIKNLKQYHAVHVCIWPTFTYFLFLCWVYYTQLKNPCVEVPAYYLGLCILAISIFFITFFFHNKCNRFRSYNFNNPNCYSKKNCNQMEFYY